MGLPLAEDKGGPMAVLMSIGLGVELAPSDGEASIGFVTPAMMGVKVEEEPETC